MWAELPTGTGLFQVSTSAALAVGVFQGAATIGELTKVGDFGLGTFDGLDGELILLDGKCFQAGSDGVVERAADDWLTPFAVVTGFTAEIDEKVDESGSLVDLTRRIDQARASDNLFYSIRVDGRFGRLSMRAAMRAKPGEGLLEATRHQSEFETHDIKGTLVGFWSPVWSETVSVPGYHFHFIADDRSMGGHVFAMSGQDLSLKVTSHREFRLLLPGTTGFLGAVLTGDHRSELHEAETGGV
jgi:acetolactate decarboxylase